ncbi:MAG: TIGR04168 family protein [Merismopedia sp. SIO2A8]|nr:TIGR04168 family protein [Merismopedia sp. SIO2A8]
MDGLQNTASSSSATQPSLSPTAQTPLPSLMIAVVGDVHDLWEAQEETILKQLGVDLVLFVGDFGNESVDVVRRVAALKIPKAAIMGNHDAWYTATPWGKTQCPYNRKEEDWVQQQLDLLGPAHVGYGRLELPQFNLTVVGSRPFSWGGSDWKYKRFYRDRFQVRNFRESVQRMMTEVEAAAHNTLIFLGHCGPQGLGDRPEDLCGKDWGRARIGGDYGDPDFMDVIAEAKMMGKSIPLVTFGHMHHHLRHRTDRERVKAMMHSDKTLYLNGASVPRIKGTGSDRLFHFSLVQLVEGAVTSARSVWANPMGDVIHNEVLYSMGNFRVQ